MLHSPVMETSLALQHDPLVWFIKSQLHSVIQKGIIPDWFHGIISRKTAEELLSSKPPGYFLIRVSESRIGYTLSYRAEDRCRHFMIDAIDHGHYSIVGETARHQCLQDLVDFHRRFPIMPYNEVLTVACGQSSNERTDYAELLFPVKNPNPNTSLHPDNSLHPITSPQISLEDVPPPLPHRPKTLQTSPVPFEGRLHQSFEGVVPDMPNPTTRNNECPEVPARSSVPPLTRTVSAPDSGYTQTQHRLSTDTPSVKSQEARPAVVSNLKNLKKKFQKKRGPNQEPHVDASERSGNNENEYEEIPGVLKASHGSSSVGLIDGELPQEYHKPPPFAPGY